MFPGHERRLGSDYLVCKNKYPTQWAAGPSLRGEWDSPRVASNFVLSCLAHTLYCRCMHVHIQMGMQCMGKAIFALGFILAVCH